MVIQILVKELEWKPKLVSKWEEEKKHGSNRSHEETQDKCWLWHYLGNPYFFVIGNSNNSPIVAKPVQILSS